MPRSRRIARVKGRPRRRRGTGKAATQQLAGTCHCGAVRIVLPRRPRTLTSCNCSICRRTGGLWAYYQAREVRIEHEPGATDHYAWGEKSLRLMRCARCGCVTHWEPTRRTPASRMGVNVRNFDPEALGEIRIRHFDGARTWKFLD
jgi:hypothetical protein